jgi:cell division transport system permease protein
MSTLAKVSYFWRSALQGLRHSPFVHLVAVLTIAIALFTTGLARVAAGLLSSVEDRLGSAVELTVYLAEGARPEEVATIAKALTARTGQAVRQVSKEEALRRLAEDLGELGEVLTEVAQNPLPASLEVKVPPARNDPDALAALSRELEGLSAVGAVDYGEAAVRRLAALSRAVRVAGGLAFLVVVAATVLITSATLQLAIYARREEIEIQKLVGATDRFVKAPFLIEGLLQGLIATLLAALGLWAAAWGLGPRVDALAAFFLGPRATLELFSLRLLAELLALGVLLGLGGSFVAVGRFARG